METTFKFIGFLFAMLVLLRILGFDLNRGVKSGAGSVAGLFGKRFLAIPLGLISFVVLNIDTIVLIIIFLTVAITYVIVYDIKLKDEKTDKVYQVHKLSFGENFSDGIGLEGIDDGSKKIMGDLFNIDLDNSFKTVEYKNICDEKNLDKLRDSCKLLKDEKTCNTPSCCMWCKTKNSCIVGSNGKPMYQIDSECM